MNMVRVYASLKLSVATAVKDLMTLNLRVDHEYNSPVHEHEHTGKEPRRALRGVQS